MRKYIFLLIIPVFIYAQNLSTLLELAKRNNNLIESNRLIEQSKSKQLDSRKSDYYPNVDIGGYYQTLNEKTQNLPGDIYSAYAKIGFDIYDGGRKSSLVESAKSEYKASSYDVDEMRRSVVLQIVQEFFVIKSLEAALYAKEDSNKLLQNQLDRVKKFYDAGLSTSDNVESLQSAFDTNMYEMESLKFEILSFKKKLELRVGEKIENLEDSAFVEDLKNDIELSASVNSLTAKQDALLSSAQSIESIYYPQIRIEDTYSIFDYKRSDLTHPDGLDNQNKLMLTLNMRLFDNSSAKESKQVLVLNSQAIEEQVKYKTKEQEIEHQLAKSRIDTEKIKIKSSKSALKSAESAFNTVEKKYKAGIVDYVAYLDALSRKADAKAAYEKSLNDLETAYAMYYFYSGKNLEDYIK